MTTGIELNDLSSTSKGKEPQSDDGIDVNEGHDNLKDGSVAAWAWVSAIMLSLLALPLILFPRFVLFLATPSSNLDGVNTSSGESLAPTPFTTFLCTHFAIFLLSISITLVLYIPSSTPIQINRRRDSLGHPLLGPLTGASLLSAFVSYNTKSVGSLGFFVFLLTAVIGIWGMWVVMFEGSSRVSNKTGADKRTSAFLFGNKSAASSQKKQWKKERLEGKSR